MGYKVVAGVTEYSFLHIYSMSIWLWNDEKKSLI